MRFATIPDHSAIQINNEIYHKNDTILFSNRDSGAPSLQIGQIQRWHWNGRNSKIEITLFKCWDEFFSGSFPALEVPLSPPVPRVFASDVVSNRLLMKIPFQGTDPRQAPFVPIQTKGHYPAIGHRQTRDHPRRL